MSLTESAGAAFAFSTSNAVTSGSYTPTANTLQVAIAVCGNGFNGATTGIAITDSVSGTWTTLVTKVLASGSMGIIAVKNAGSSPSSQTVTATGTSSGVDGILLITRQFAGAAPAASQNGVTVAAGAASTQGYTQAITPGTTGSQVVGGYAQSSSGVALTVNGSTTAYKLNQNSTQDTEALFEAASLSTAGTPITLGFTNGGTASAIFVLAEILPASGTTAPAGAATATGAAQQPAASVTAKAGLATATGTAQQPAASVTAKAGLATATGTAQQPAVLTGDVAPAGLATATGTAQQPRTAVTAFAGLATATGTAQQPKAAPAALAGLASGTGTAQQPAASVTAKAGLAAAAGTALQPRAVVLRTPLNLGAVLTEHTPDATFTLQDIGATFTLPDYGATLVLSNFGASLTGWTMQTAPLNLSEFNDVTIGIAVTQNGSPYNLTGVTLNLLLKTAAGTPDANALVFSSGGGSPAITITNAAQGLATAVIPNTDLDAETYSFYRLDVVSGGLTNTTLYGAITWTTL